MLFVNGLPLVVVELKNPGAVQASLRSALNQLQTYKEEIPSLFAYNELLMISDGMRAGTLTSGWDRFALRTSTAPTFIVSRATKAERGRPPSGDNDVAAGHAEPPIFGLCLEFHYV